MKDLDKQIKDLRKEFQQGLLEESHINADPHIQFGIWLKQAIDAKVNEPNAMSLSTVNENGKPSSRIVLLREFSENGYAFFTNYQSRKGSELTRNKNACLLFFWPELERQLRIEGTVEIHSPSASDNYFNSRPRNSRIGAWSSPQSSVINGRIELENLVSEFDKKYPNENVPRPEFWGGYLLKPTYYEFWQGRENRLHDRISYKITGEDTWKIERLAP